MAQSTKLAGGAPISAPSLVSCDQVTILGDGSALHPLHAAGGGNTFKGQNAGGSIIPGMLVSSHSSFGALAPPIGPTVNAAATQPVGIALQAAPTLSNDIIDVQMAGIVTLTTAEWDAVAGTTGGLTRGDIYYQSQSTPGLITSTTPTTGQHVVQAGVAISTTQLRVVLSAPTIAP